MRAIFLLLFFQIRRGLIQLVTDPRKLIPTVVLLGFYWWGALNRSPITTPFQSGTNPAAGLVPIIQAVNAFLLFVLAFVSLSSISSGFQGAYLGFSVPDIDYLMSSPVSRRLLLALKVLKVNLTGFGLTAILWLVFKIFIPPFFPKGHEGFSLGELALFCCLTGVMQIGLAISAHVGKRRDGFLIAQFAALFLFLATVVVIIVRGVSTASAFLNLPVFSHLFFWCRWATDAMVIPLTGHSGLIPALETIAFYLVTFVLVFARPANFYETAFFVTHDMEQLREARVKSAGTGDMTVIFARQYEKKSDIGKDKRLYTLSAFGTGAMAVFWANLCCMFKRPWVNLGFPAMIGLFLGGLNIWQPDVTGLPVVAVFISAMLIGGSGMFAFLPLINRRSLLGPLPIAPWKMACADILPFAFTCCLPILVLAALLAIGHVPNTANLVILFFTCAPVIIIGLTAIPYIAVTNFSSMTQDVIIQGIAYGSIYLGLPVACALYAPMILAPAAAGFSPWFIGFAAMPGCIALTGLLLNLAGRCYANIGAQGDAPPLLQTLRTLNTQPRRIPAFDEGLWLGILLLAGAVYNGIWLINYGFIWNVVGNEALYVALALLFACIGRYDFRVVFNWRLPSIGKVMGGLLMGLGTIPWLIVLNFNIAKIWHPNMGNNNAILHFIAVQLALHPILTPLLTAALAGICEEIAFRGPIQTALVKRLGPKWGILLCAFLFAAWHLDYFGLLGRTIIGIGLGWIVWRGKSIFPAMLAHFAIDAATFGYYSYLVHTKGVGALHIGAIPNPHITANIAWILLGSMTALIIGWLLIEKSSDTQPKARQDLAVSNA